MIRCEGLTKWYGDFLALDHLDLTLREGDLFGFIGPNGAGKTTSMKILATLLLPSAGRAFVNGVDVVDEPDQVRRLVGYMPDFFGVYPEMRVQEYLAFFAAAYRVPRRERDAVVSDLLTLVDLSDRAENLVGSLSRGMQQRLGLARALVHDPKVLILDEPASGLDPRARVEMRAIFKELQRMGKTLILSSHILPELADVCNRIGIIARGKLMASGPIDEVSAQVAPPRIRARVVRELGDDAPDDAVAMSEVEAAEAAAAYVGAQLGDVADVTVEAGFVQVTPQLGARVRVEDVASLLVREGYGLRALDSVVPSLEEVFLSLTEAVEGAG